jgi:hypothetical protein
MASEQNPFGVDFDLTSEQQNVSRQQMMADMLMRMAFQPAAQGRMVSGHYVAPSIFESLNPVLGAFGGQYAQQGADAARKKLQEAYNAKLSGGLDSYFKQRDGTPAGQTAAVPAQNLPTEDGMGFDMPENPGMAYPATPGNPRRAAINALTSGLPALARLGQSDLESLSKGQLTPLEIFRASGASLPSRIAAGTAGDPRLLRPEQRLQALGDRLYDVTEGTGEPQLRLDARPKYAAPVDIRGDLFQNEIGTGKLQKLDNGTSVRIGNTSIGAAGETALSKGLGQKASEAYATLGETARNSRNLLGTLDQLSRLSEGGVLDGPASRPAIFLQGLARSAGVKYDTTKLTNSEAYTGLAREAVQQLVGQYGGNRGITKEEAAQIQEIIPQLTQSPDARRKLTEILRGVAQRNMVDFEKATNALRRSRETGDEGIFIDAINSMWMPSSEILPTVPAAAPSPQSQSPGGASPGLTLPPGFRIIEVLPPRRDR